MSSPGDGPISLVTGANKGIGFAIAKGLSQLGHTVLVGARDQTRGEAAAADLRTHGGDARFLSIDLTNPSTVTQAAAWIDQHFGRLDGLVNNAAIKLEWHPSPPSTAPMELVRQTFETNVFGTMTVIQAMLPLLERSPSPRIVNMSSGLGSLALSTKEGSKYQQRPLLSYNVAKAAVNSLTVQFANELRATPIKVNAADPGYTNTDMTLRTGTRNPEDGAVVAIRLATLPDDGPTGCFFDERGPLPW